MTRNRAVLMVGCLVLGPVLLLCMVVSAQQGPGFAH